MEKTISKPAFSTNVPFEADCRYNLMVQVAGIEATVSVDGTVLGIFTSTDNINGFAGYIGLRTYPGILFENLEVYESLRDPFMIGSNGVWLNATSEFLLLKDASISFESNWNEPAAFEVTDASGKIYASQSVSPVDGSYHFTFQPQGTPGMQKLKIKRQNGEEGTKDIPMVIKTIAATEDETCNSFVESLPENVLSDNICQG